MVLMIPSNCFKVLYELSINNFNISTNLNKQTTSYTLKETKTIGLSTLIYIVNDSLPSDTKVIITVSSKILLDKSPELIHKDNFQTVIENINKLGIVDLNYSDVIKYAQVYRIDCTLDIPVVDKQLLFSYLKSQPCIKHYKSEYPSSMVFQSNAKRNNERVIFYDKKKEMNLLCNKKLIEQLSQDSIDYFKDKIRLELNLKTFEQIRKYLKIETTSLKEIFESQANPLLEVFCKIFKESESSPSIDDLKKKSEIEKILGRISLLHQHNYDINKVYHNLISLGFKVNRTAFNKEYQEASDFHRRINSSDLNYIDKIKELLSA